MTSILTPNPALPRGLACLPLEGRLYLAPAGLVAGSAARVALASGQGRPLAGADALAFLSARLTLRTEGGMTDFVVSLADLGSWMEDEGERVALSVQGWLARLSDPRPSFAGLDVGHPLVMGIVNVTPDSFSDGGEHADSVSAVAHGVKLLEQGADILDVGGESTRPGAGELDPEVESARVVPVIRALAEKGAVVSVDTRHARVMAASVAAGAAIVNDITALEGDPGAMAEVARSGAAVVLMHMRGTPATMQQAPEYDCAPLDVFDYLEARLAACEAAGIEREKICVDPGIGFGKTVVHNAELLGRLSLLHALGVPVLLGASRKRFIAGMSRGEPPKDRMAGSIAAVLAGLAQGVQIVRVHDVAETVQAVKVWSAMAAAS